MILSNCSHNITANRTQVVTVKMSVAITTAGKAGNAAAITWDQVAYNVTTNLTSEWQSANMQNVTRNLTSYFAREIPGNRTIFIEETTSVTLDVRSTAELLSPFNFTLNISESVHTVVDRMVKSFAKNKSSNILILHP